MIFAAKAIEVNKKIKQTKKKNNWLTSEILMKK